MKIFADDTKLYRAVSRHTDPHALQEDLDGTVRWAEEWQLSFIAAKCNVLQMGHLSRHHVYTLAGAALDETD